jgi:transposase, IS30 family
MRHYTQLTIEQRYQISGLKKSGFNQSRIATDLNIHKSTISRELKRNKGQRGWRPRQAQERATERRRGCVNAKKFVYEDWLAVDKLILQDLSPAPIAGRMALENTLQISHETIYQHIYDDKHANGDLWVHLRCQKSCRKRYGSGQERRGMLKNRISIDERPVIVEKKERIGDWEGDTVIGKGQKGALVTLTERASRYTLASMLPSKHAEGVTATIIGLLAPHKGKRHTMTFDNGKEFAGHENISRHLGISVYFAHPYHSWERGLNENTNGLLRQYFPKGSSFDKVTKEQVQQAVDRLNHRPRKILGFKTPFEVFFDKTRRYCPASLKVALRS